MHYVYILTREIRNDKEFYIGYTNNLVRRLAEHEKEYKCQLAYYEAYQLEKLARDRERKLKHYGSAWRALKSRL